MAYTEFQKKTRANQIVANYANGNKNAQIVSTEHQDGYINVLNKYGTTQDNSEAYEWVSNTRFDPMSLELNYEGNGLFAKIIDTPASEAIKHGFKLTNVDDDVNTSVMKKLDKIGFMDETEVGIKWTRLFGGGLMVMLIDDGGRLDEEVNYKKVRGISEVHVFESPLVSWNQGSIYNSAKGLFGMPEFFEVSSQCGSFKVHHSRCLCFKNGRLPENASDSLAQFWGVPEYVRIKSFLREVITSSGFSVKMMERSVQPVYSVKDLGALLSTSEGEDIVVKRLQIIDICRSLLNTIAIDANGEGYEYKTAPFTGVQEVIDAACTLLSAVTNIPQTILFGRSPAGMNATGESDFENYYNSVEHIQQKTLKRNFQKVIDLVLLGMLHKGEIDEIPEYEIEFNPLWSLSETEQATVDQTRAQTALIKAQTAQIYTDMGALDSTEVRAGLAASEDYQIEELLDSIPPEDLFDDIEETEEAPTGEGSPESGDVSAEVNTDEENDTPTAAAVIVLDKKGNVLCGKRGDNNLICGPGGHIEEGEAPIQAAIRESQEEFGITPVSLVPLTTIGENKDGHHKSAVFLCNAYEGIPECDNEEMFSPLFVPLTSLLCEQFNSFLFAPFRQSLIEFEKVAQIGQLSDIANSDECGIINEDKNIPSGDLKFFTAENGKRYAVNESTGETSGLGKDIDKSTSQKSSSPTNRSVGENDTQQTGSKSKIDIQLFAKIPDEKLSGYALDPIKSPDKARVFKSALGYTRENASELKKDIEKHFDIEKCKIKATDQYGTRLEQIMHLAGPNGKEANVCTAWIKESEDSEPRLVSCYIVKREE